DGARRAGGADAARVPPAGDADGALGTSLVPPAADRPRVGPRVRVERRPGEDLHRVPAEEDRRGSQLAPAGGDGPRLRVPVRQGRGGVKRMFSTSPSRTT